MTKKKEDVQLNEALTQLPVETQTSAGLEVANQANDSWVRSNALEQAIMFHKNNGGMYQANHITTTAQAFLDFIKGETK